MYSSYINWGTTFHPLLSHCISAILGDFQSGWWTSHTYPMNLKIIKILIPSKPGALCSQQLLHACLDSSIGTPWMSPGCSSGAESFSSPFCFTVVVLLWLRIRQNKPLVCFQVSSTKSGRIPKQTRFWANPRFFQKGSLSLDSPHQCMYMLKESCLVQGTQTQPAEIWDPAVSVHTSHLIPTVLFWFGVVFIPSSASLTQRLSLFLCPNHTGEPSPAGDTVG